MFTCYCHSDLHVKCYCDSELKMDLSLGYFNTGVMMLYLKKYNDVGLLNDILRALNEPKNPFIAKKDIYNSAIHRNKGVY